MAKIRFTQRFPLGTRVKKYFKGYKNPFEGLVDHHSDLTDFYHISYEDGDSEEMTEEDVNAHLLSLPKPKRPPKTPKLTKASKLRKPSTPLEVKRDNGDKSIGVAVVSSSTVTKEKKRPTVLSLNANAPGLVRKNSFTGSCCSHEETSEQQTVSIPGNTPNKVEEEEDKMEEEEMKDNKHYKETDGDLLEGTPEKIKLLIGKPVERIVAKDGCGTDVVQGAVASYFPATKMFRVMYFDGDCCDLTYQEVLDSIPADSRSIGTGGKKKRKKDKSFQNGGKERHSTPSSSLKRSKTFDMNTKAIEHIQRSSTVIPPSSGAQPPSGSVIHETDMEAVDNVEFNIVRKVLFIIVSTVNNTVMGTQLEALSSADLKDKKALEVFVQKDGLASLAELLSRWEDQVEMEQGVLLVLKVLAVLPGVTKDVIIDSRIGKKVRGIEKRGSYRDSAIPGLATWVIQKLKADVGVQKVDQKPSIGVNDKTQRDEKNHLRGSSSQRRDASSLRGTKRDDHLASSKPTDSSRQQDSRLDKGKTLTVSNDGGRSNSASHLLSLMNSRNGRDTSTSRRDRDIFGNVVNTAKTGTLNHWQARRSTVVIDQVNKLLNGNAPGVKFVKTKPVEDDDWKPSKISFADDNAVCAFDKDVAVSKLLVFHPPGSTKASECPLAKQHSGPLRSILRVRLSLDGAPEIASQSNDKQSQSASPTILSTARAGTDPVVIPTLLSSEVSEDEATESPTVKTSKQFEVVSRTEERKQDLSAPRRIPISMQLLLHPTDEAEDDTALASGNDDNTINLPVETTNEPKPAVKVLIEALSPVLSEDVSLEDGEESSRDISDSAPKPKATTLESCSTGPDRVVSSSPSHYFGLMS